MRAIVDVCGWDLETLGTTNLLPAEELARIGIGRTWPGPADVPYGGMGGRNYQRRRVKEVERPSLDG